MGIRFSDLRDENGTFKKKIRKPLTLHAIMKLCSPNLILEQIGLQQVVMSFQKDPIEALRDLQPEKAGTIKPYYGALKP